MTFPAIQLNATAYLAIEARLKLNKNIISISGSVYTFAQVLSGVLQKQANVVNKTCLGARLTVNVLAKFVIRE